VHPCAAPCIPLQSRRRNYAPLLASPTLSQAEGRRFDPGLALQYNTTLNYN